MRPFGKYIIMKAPKSFLMTQRHMTLN